jgi:ribosomal-protein-alanine N-acetyltransferase
MLEIENASFPAPWHRMSFESELGERTSRSLVVKERREGSADVLVGYIFFRVIEDEMHILTLAVDGAHRRRGLGTLLLTQGRALAWKEGARTAFLEVRPSNSAARKLYEKLGFCVVGRRPRYYMETGEDAIVMAKNLRGGAKSCAHGLGKMVGRGSG